MATAPISYFRASPVLCSVSPQSNHHKRDPTGQKVTSNWWTPLFGWSSDPDYIIQGSNSNHGRYPIKGEPGQPEKKMGLATRSKFGVGCFTEEKAQELRRKTTETSTFHDIMYHSAIASRLALDVSGGHQER